MVTFKGSAYHSMRVIPHRPFFHFLKIIAIFAVFVICILASYYAGIYRVSTSHASLRFDRLQQHEHDMQSFNQEITKLHTNAEVDRQTIESMRQLVMTQKAQMAASERDLRVYKDLLTPGAKVNPLGISFGLFTVFALPESGHFTYSLVVQKLSAKESGFIGNLDFRVMGEQAGKLVTLPLYQVSDQQTSPTIPLDFKYFQTVEGEFQLPLDFVPQVAVLMVKSSDKKSPLIVETQLEWPVSSH